MQEKINENEEKTLKAFGKSILALSSEKGKSLEKIAYEAGISKSFIYEVANGKGNPSLLILSRIAAALDTPIWKILKPIEE